MKLLEQLQQLVEKLNSTTSTNTKIEILKWFNFFLDYKLYAPISIIYFTSITHSFALGMSIFSIEMVSSALLEIPTGVISDRIGRKKLL